MLKKLPFLIGATFLISLFSASALLLPAQDQLMRAQKQFTLFNLQGQLAQVSSTSSLCNSYTNTTPPPEGYGAAYNLFSAARELLLNVTCNNNTTATFSSGNGANTTYIWHQGYYTKNARDWVPISLTGSNTAGGGLWIIGTANVTEPMTTAEQQTQNYYASYVCTYQTNTWKCGCQDSTCAVPSWNLQGFRKTTQSTGGGTVSGNSPTNALCSTATPTRQVSTAPELDSALKNLNPGDVLKIAAGTYNLQSVSGSSNPPYTITGTATNPIIICGSGVRETTIAGSNNANGSALRLLNSSYVTLANLVITNPDQQGFDGRTTRACGGEAGCTNKNEEGLVIDQSHHITIRENAFRNIGTRGVFVNPGSNNNVFRYNIFSNVGNNTASGDINVNGGTAEVYGNILAGNTDGFVVDGSNEVGHIVERNICVNHWQENCVDIKNHDSGRSGTEFSIVRSNVMHGEKQTSENTLHVSNGSRWVNIYDNFIQIPDIADKRGILVLGRDNQTGDLDIHGNCIVGTKTPAVGILGNRQDADIVNVSAHDNTFVNVDTLVSGSGITNSGGNVSASACPTNLTNLEGSILNELSGYFTNTEISAALAN